MLRRGLFWRSAAFNALRTGWRRFKSAREGVSAVEFAIIAPVMISMWIGTVEVGRAVGVSWKAKLVARTLADLTGRTTIVSNQGMANIFSATAAVLYPYDPTRISMRISSVKRISATRDEVVWSDVSPNSTVLARTNGEALTLPNGLLNNVGDTVIYAETFYRFTPMTAWASDNPGDRWGGFFALGGGYFPINYEFYMVPRLAEVVRDRS